MPARKTLLLIDDHPVVRAGIRLSLDGSATLEVCGEADTVPIALEKARVLRPDLVLLDLLLNEKDGFNLIEGILDLLPDTKIVVYSMLNEMVYAQRAIQAGARGYVMKSEPLASVLLALETVEQDGYYVSAQVQRAVLANMAGQKKTGAANPLDILSNRELEVFRLLGLGLSSAQVAGKLNLNVKTVGSFRERLKNKLGVDTSRELERQAEAFLKTGRLSPEDGP